MTMFPQRTQAEIVAEGARRMQAVMVGLGYRPGIVYFMLLPNGLLKVGFTDQPKTRLATHATYGAQLIGLCAGTALTEWEWHQKLNQWRVSRSRRGRSKELFSCPADVIEEIKAKYGERK